jgi:PhzF family phenazine biosynthesis protein
MPETTLFQVDSFTTTPFTGNPAGVCLLQSAPPESWLQAMAAEMNLSETAFLIPEGEARFSLRWFTPKAEVPLCGHATLASAHILWSECDLSPEQELTFITRSGELTAKRENNWIRLDFPVLSIHEVTAEPDVIAALSEALGADPVAVYQNAFPSYLVELASEKTVRQLTPDFAAISRLGSGRCIVTAPAQRTSGDTADGNIDFVSRFFAPQLGINEDPVTGSAHCSLAPYWAAKLGKSELMARQVSARSGLLKLRLHGDRVHIFGKAVTVFRLTQAAQMIAP